MDHDETKALFLAAYDEYADAIYRFCLMKVSSGEVAEDLAQETFTRFWQELRKGTVLKSERALLYTIARNLVIDWYRKKKEQSLDVALDAGIEFPDLGADADASTKAEMEQVLKVVNGLDAPSRDVILYRFMEGLTPAEIGALSGESANAISVRLNRALKQVRERLHTHAT